jgi:AcrR family transcriptional regulator
MSRPRTISQDEILDATEAVVGRDGAARLTLDAVACEAGTSKARVLYDYKSKEALIRAVIERRLHDQETRLRALIGEQVGPDAALTARIELTSEKVADDGEAVVLNLCSALAHDGEMRALIGKTVRDGLAEVVETSRNPRLATVAFLAVEGIRSLEFMGLLRFSTVERAQILSDVAALLAEPDRLSGVSLRPPIDGSH